MTTQKKTSQEHEWNSNKINEQLKRHLHPCR